MEVTGVKIMENKIVVNSKTLLTSLQLVSKAMAKNSSISIIENYLVEVNGTRVIISGTDLQSTFSVLLPIDKVNATYDTPFNFILDKGIVKYLQKLDEQPVSIASIVIEGKNKKDEIVYACSVIVEANDDKVKYSVDYANDFPKKPSCIDAYLDTDTALFAELKDLLNYVDSNELRPAMTGIGFITHDKKFTLCATDGMRLKYYDASEKVILCFNNNQTDRQHFILPAKPAKILSDLKFKGAESVRVSVKYNGATINPAIDNMMFEFRYNEFQAFLTVRNIDEKYPQYWQVIPHGEPKTKFTVAKAQFLKVLDKANLFANKVTHQVRISLNGKNTISAEDLDFNNEYSGIVGGSYVGEPMDIGFNAELLREVVNSFGESFTLELNAPNKAGLIRDGKSVALCMPVMLNQYVAKSAEELARELREARENAKQS